MIIGYKYNYAEMINICTCRGVRHKTKIIIVSKPTIRRRHISRMFTTPSSAPMTSFSYSAARVQRRALCSDKYANNYCISFNASKSKFLVVLPPKCRFLGDYIKDCTFYVGNYYYFFNRTRSTQNEQIIQK